MGMDNKNLKRITQAFANQVMKTGNSRTDKTGDGLCQSSSIFVQR